MMMPTLQTYWITICVEMFRAAPLAEFGREQKDAIGGYFRNFGVTAGSKTEACGAVAKEVLDGNIDWSESKVLNDVISRLDDEILAKSGDWHREGIWYRSGHVFFPPD